MQQKKLKNRLRSLIFCSLKERIKRRSDEGWDVQLIRRERGRRNKDVIRFILGKGNSHLLISFN
jgi:hypothetical protein